MFKRLTLASALIFSMNVWALSCSDLVTISDPRLDAYEPNVAANEKGGAALLWFSDEKHTEAVGVAYKMQNSSWSSAENISGWKRGIYYKNMSSFVTSEGDILTTWQVNEGDNSLILGAKKESQESWTPVLDIMRVENSSYLLGTTLNSKGQLIIVNKSEGSYNSKAWRNQTLIDIAAKDFIQSKRSDSGDKFDTYLNEGDAYISNLTLLSDKQGNTYVFWGRSLNGKYELVCQRLQNGQVLEKTQVICQLPEPVYTLKGNCNAKGDVVLATGKGKIIAKVGETWTVVGDVEEEHTSNVQVSIDDQANIMVAYEISYDDSSKIGQMSSIKALYKPVNQRWMEPVIFSRDEADNESPLLNIDKKGNFILVWESIVRNRPSIFGASFSSEEGKWSDPQLLSPEGQVCYSPSFTFYAPGKGYMSWVTTPNGFDSMVQVAELSN